MALLARAVQNHKGLTFNPLDLHPDSKQVVLAASGTVLLHVAPLYPDVWGAAQSVRLHRAGLKDELVKKQTGMLNMTLKETDPACELMTDASGWSS